LQRRIAAGWPASGSTARAPRRAWMRGRGIAAAAALSTVLAVVVGGTTAVVVQDHADARRVAEEAVNDHLRMLGGAPLAQVTGGLHEVKPWFGGKLDFAPTVGSPETPTSPCRAAPSSRSWIAARRSSSTNGGCTPRLSSWSRPTA
jgi:hypothetical protein